MYIDTVSSNSLATYAKRGDSGFTTKLNVVVLPRGVPVTVIGTMPSGVEGLVVMVSVLVQVGVQVGGAKAAVAPAGSPAAAKVTACAVPATSVAVIVVAPEPPC